MKAGIERMIIGLAKDFPSVILYVLLRKLFIFPKNAAKRMRPNGYGEPGQRGLFRSMELEEGLDQRHELYRLAGAIRWERLEEAFVPLYAERGRPGLADPTDGGLTDSEAVVQSQRRVGVRALAGESVHAILLRRDSLPVGLSL